MQILKNVNWIDLLIIILMIRITYVTLQGGVTHELFPFLRSLIVLVVSLRYYAKFGQFISRNILNIPTDISYILSFLILVFASFLVLKLVNALIDKLVKFQFHPVIERFGGFVIGLFKAAIISSLVIIIIALIPVPYFQTSIKDKSLTGMYFLKIGPAVYEKVITLIPPLKPADPQKAKELIIRNIISRKSIAAGSNDAAVKEQRNKRDEALDSAPPK